MAFLARSETLESSDSGVVNLHIYLALFHRAEVITSAKLSKYSPVSDYELIGFYTLLQLIQLITRTSRGWVENALPRT